MSRAQPRRWIVTACMLTTSPLAIHAGTSFADARALGLTERDEFRPAAGDCPALADCDRLLVRDARGLPYLPGSTLKGVLRHYLWRDKVFAPEVAVARLLGTDAGNDESLGSGGAATFENAYLLTSDDDAHEFGVPAPGLGDWYASLRANRPVAPKAPLQEAVRRALRAAFAAPHSDWRRRTDSDGLLETGRNLPWWSAADMAYVEQHTTIDRRTGTVDHGKLFNEEVVPAGVPFGVRVILDDPDDRGELRSLLLRALAACNGDPLVAPPQFGSGTSHGWGRVACLTEQLTVEERTPTGKTTLNAKALKELWRVPAFATPRSVRVEWEFALHGEGAFLVNDPAKSAWTGSRPAVVAAAKGADAAHDAKAPDHVPRVAATYPSAHTPGNPSTGPSATARPLLPATSAKGSLRSALEAIWRTIAPGTHVSPLGQLEALDDSTPGWIRQLLGDTDLASRLWCSEFVGGQDLPLQSREFLASDRWTGSVAGSAKFDALVFERPVLTGVVCLEIPDAPSCPLLVASLALLARDLLEGDVKFGFGQTKGFARFRAVSTRVRLSGADQRIQEFAEQLQLPEIASADAWNARLAECHAGGDAPSIERLDQALDRCLTTLRKGLVAGGTTA